MQKLFSILIILFIINTTTFSQDKATVIYIGDPMCSWCYGFSPEFSETIESIGESVDLQMVMGGLRPYNKETMADLKDFLQEHWKEVHERSGQQFSYDILDNPEIPYDTEPSCRAVVTMRQFKPNSELSYFKDIQVAFYAENKDPLSTETFANLAEKYGVDKESFAISFESQEMKDAVRKDFSFAQQLNARSFPTVIVKKGNDYFLVGQGYLKAADLEKNIRQATGL